MKRATLTIVLAFNLHFINTSFSMDSSPFEPSEQRWIKMDSSDNSIEVDTAKLENMLWDYLHKNSQRNFEAPETYKFQYTVINSSIRINAFCWLPENFAKKHKFQKDEVIVWDGGTCYFRVIYENGAFINLYINGPTEE